MVMELLLYLANCFLLRGEAADRVVEVLNSSAPTPTHCDIAMPPEVREVRLGLSVKEIRALRPAIASFSRLPWESDALSSGDPAGEVQAGRQIFYEVLGSTASFSTAMYTFIDNALISVSLQTDIDRKERHARQQQFLLRFVKLWGGAYRKTIISQEIGTSKFRGLAFIWETGACRQVLHFPLEEEARSLKPFVGVYIEEPLSATSPLNEEKLDQKRVGLLFKEAHLDSKSVGEFERSLRKVK